MGQDGRAVANFVLDVCDEEGILVTNLALQKLVYFCHAWHLVEFDEPLIKQDFEAWDYGPVLQYLYREFKHCGRSAIRARSKKLNRFSGKQEIALFEAPKDKIEFLRKVIGFYGKLTASQLVEISHAEGGPWDKVWNHDGKINPGMRIENADIRSYYSTLPRAAKVQ